MKPPTPQGISALLARAGYARSERKASMIKGLREHTDGFLVVKSDTIEGAVEVEHITSSINRHMPEERREKMLTAYTETLTAAGWAVRLGEHTFVDYLIVTTPKGDS